MADKQHLRRLLSDAIPDLCRNGLPPSATFRVEALIGITVIDGGRGANAVSEGNVTLLSFQQTVSDGKITTSEFGSNDTVTAVPYDGSTVSHMHCPPPKQASTGNISVKQEYLAETLVKQEYDAKSYPSHATVHPQTTDTYEEYGTADDEEVEYLGEDGDYVGEEDYYEDDDQYYDDGTGYPSDVKFETQDDAYMERADDGSYVQTEDYGHLSTGRLPKHTIARSRASAMESQPGPSKVRKTGQAARGGSRPRTGRASYDTAAATVVSAVCDGTT